MDETEKQLTDAYNAAVDKLRTIPRGDPAAKIAATARVTAALRALRKYQNRHKK